MLVKLFIMLIHILNIRFKFLLKRLYEWITANKLRSIPLIVLAVFLIIAFFIGDAYQIQGVLLKVIWWTPLLLLSEIERLVNYLKKR